MKRIIFVFDTIAKLCRLKFHFYIYLILIMCYKTRNDVMLILYYFKEIADVRKNRNI